MPSAIDVFLSYAREDTLRAERLASMLTAERISVWWDRSLLAGQDWSHVIEEQLNTAGCVVVLWSRAAVQSRFVRDEARRAIERDAYVPVLLEDCRLPLGFGETQVERLIQHAGEREPSLDRLLLAIRSKLGAPEPRVVIDPPRGQRSHRKVSEKRNGPWWFVLVAAALAVVVAVAATTSKFCPGEPRPGPTVAPTPKAGGVRLLTRLEVVDEILLRNRPSIERCVNDNKVNWVLYLDFMFTPQLTSVIRVDTFSSSAAGRNAAPSLKALPEEFERFPGPTELSAAFPMLNLCLVGVIEGELKGRSLPDAKWGYRYLTNEGTERVRRLRQISPEIQINLGPDERKR